MDSPEFEFRFTCGVTQPTYGMKLEDKHAIVSSLCRHFTIYATAAELDQFIKGLETLNFHSLMLQYPSIFQKVFMACDQTITADFIQDFYDVLYSPVGSNKRKTEESIIMNWINYLHDIEGIPKQLVSL